MNPSRTKFLLNKTCNTR
uniref:Uncharacterized protein n=1 Tax=Anguilla anguilla TaxID=7936 RepID=A0A0E9XGD3_ANGAN